LKIKRNGSAKKKKPGGYPENNINPLELNYSKLIIQKEDLED